MCVAVYMYMAKDNCSMPVGSGTCMNVTKAIYDTVFLPDILLNSHRNISMLLYYLGITRYNLLHLSNDISPCKEATSWTH